MKKKVLRLLIVFVLMAAAIWGAFLHSNMLYFSKSKACEAWKSRIANDQEYAVLLERELANGNGTIILADRSQTNDNLYHERYVIAEVVRKGFYWQPGQADSINTNYIQKKTSETALFLEPFLTLNSSVIYGICADNSVKALRVSTAVNTGTDPQWSLFGAAELLHNPWMVDETRLVFCDLTSLGNGDNLLIMIEAIDNSGSVLWKRIVA